MAPASTPVLTPALTPAFAPILTLASASDSALTSILILDLTPASDPAPTLASANASPVLTPDSLHALTHAIIQASDPDPTTDLTLASAPAPETDNAKLAKLGLCLHTFYPTKDFHAQKLSGQEIPPLLLIMIKYVRLLRVAFYLVLQVYFLS